MLVCKGEGKGRNVKMAKQEAARTLLINIDTKNERMITGLKKEMPTSPAAAPPGPGSSTTTAASLGLEPQLVPVPDGNPVGELGELCMQFKLFMPVYTVRFDNDYCWKAGVGFVG